MASSIAVGVAPDGALTYFVPVPPGELPPVRGQDLMAAWTTAHEAARQGSWGQRRQFCFRSPEGGITELALRDVDACCWAAAIDRTLGLGSLHGLSVCLRLLALVQLIGGAGAAGGLFAIEAGDAALHPALWRAAAESPLTDTAGFDAPRLLARLARDRAPAILPDANLI